MRSSYTFSYFFCFAAAASVQGFLPQPPSSSCYRSSPIRYSASDDPGFDRDRPSKSNNQLLELKWNVRKLFNATSDTDASILVGQSCLKDIYQEIISSPQEDLVPQQSRTDEEGLPTPVDLKNSELEKVRLFLQSYPNFDMGHAGRFGVGDDHFSLQANLVFAMDQPLRYLQEHLSYSASSSNRNKEEVVVFCPGPQTSLSQSARQQEYLSRVLDGMPLAVLHTGMHHEATKAYLSADAVLSLRSLDLMVDSTASPIEGGLYQLQPPELDLLRSVVAWESDAEFVEDPLVESLVKLIDMAVHSVRTDQPEPRLVLVAYSATARALSVALNRWKHLATNHNHQLRNSGLGPSKASALLRQAVTIVTIGGLCQSYPDGPAYIHVSMHDDRLTTQAGGQDAVVLQALSPYHTTTDETSLLAHDAHNPQASAIQFLSLTLRKNGLTSFQQLYQAGSLPTPKLDIAPKLFALNYYSNKMGELDLPNDDLLASMIRATGGQRWLEHPIDDEDDILPDCLNAEATIAEHFGYGVYEEIVEACSGNADEEDEYC